MRVHVFGNKPSPSIANYALHKTADVASSSYGEDIRNFVQRNFYVDDALTYLPTKEEAIDLLIRTKDALMTLGKIRLHKFVSNDGEVMKNLPSEDLAKDLKRKSTLIQKANLCSEVADSTGTLKRIRSYSAFP